MTIRRRPSVRLLPFLLAASLGACASAGSAPAAGSTDDAAPSAAASSASSGSADARVVPPRMLTSAPVRIQTTQRVVAGAPSMPSMRQAPDVELRVDIDAAGKPDMGSLVISGRDAPDNRETLRDWVASARFAPATRDGAPVAGVFRWPRR